MRNTDPLIWYGFAVIIVMAGFVIMPYVRRKSDLLTAWNALLVGIAVYVGLGALEAATTDVGGVFPELTWYRPSKSDVRWYMLSSTVFIAALLIGYYYNPVSRRLSERTLQKWPPLSLGLLIYVLAACFAIIFADVFTRGFAFLGPSISNLSRKAWIVAAMFTFIYWYTRRRNLPAFAIFASFFVLAIISSMAIFFGRRMLISVMLTPILGAYWLSMRYWSVKKCFAVLCAAGAVVFLAAAGYSTFRSFSIQDKTRARTRAEVMNEISNLDVGRIGRLMGRGPLRFFAQSNAHYGMLLHHIIEDGGFEPAPANTLAFLAVYPVPRRIWPNKPQTVGVMYPNIARLPHRANFGVGISGHGAFEGGLPILVVYALLAAFGIRFLDGPLRNQPANPFLLSLQAAALPHVLAFTRGDFAIMSVETATCFVFIIPLGILGRALFGTQPILHENRGARRLTSFASNRYVTR